MSVVRTDKWLLDSYVEPIEICEKLKSQFDNADALEIYDYLILHGMYNQPSDDGKTLIKKLQKNKIWETVQTELEDLERIWGGPDIPIFIFPAGPMDRTGTSKHSEKSGLAFHDKLFLFISENIEDNDIKSLLTHEYNHVCRLSKYHKNEEDYLLLDTIILEGLAENAVRERFGEAALAAWTIHFTVKEQRQLWKNLIYPNRFTPRFDHTHQEILYGMRAYPHMAGYSAGYYLVKKFMDDHNKTSKDLLSVESEIIANTSN